MPQVVITDPESFSKIIGRGFGLPRQLDCGTFITTTMNAPSLKIMGAKEASLRAMFERNDYDGDIEILSPAGYEPGIGDIIIIYKSAMRYLVFNVQ